MQQEVWVSSVQLDEWRQLGWWLREQSRPQGVRHRGRFFERLLPREQQLNNAAGGDYRIIAQNRDIWREREQVYIQNMDVKWASGRQDSLEWQ